MTRARSKDYPYAYSTHIDSSPAGRQGCGLHHRQKSLLLYQMMRTYTTLTPPYSPPPLSVLRGDESSFVPSFVGWTGGVRMYDCIHTYIHTRRHRQNHGDIHVHTVVHQHYVLSSSCLPVLDVHNIYELTISYTCNQLNRCSFPHLGRGMLRSVIPLQLHICMYVREARLIPTSPCTTSSQYRISTYFCTLSIASHKLLTGTVDGRLHWSNSSKNLFNERQSRAVHWGKEVEDLAAKQFYETLPGTIVRETSIHVASHIGLNQCTRSQSLEFVEGIGVLNRAAWCHRACSRPRVG